MSLTAKLQLTASLDMSRPINILHPDFERKNMELCGLWLQELLSLLPSLSLPFLPPLPIPFSSSLLRLLRRQINILLVSFGRSVRQVMDPPFFLPCFHGPRASRSKHYRYPSNAANLILFALFVIIFLIDR